MRAARASFHEPAPMSMPVSELEEELVAHWFIAQDKAHAWLGFLGSECKTSGDVMSKVSQDAMVSASEAAELTDEEVLSIRMCLGSPSNPFHFPRFEILVDDKKDVFLKKPKGGALKEVAEVLTVPSMPMDAAHYFPPPCFDAHRPGLESRNEEQLRI